MATLYVDNVPYHFEGEHRDLLDVCLSLGLDVPYFCWHPAMHSVGACRQCAVKQFADETDTRGRIVMACMTEAADGMRISINDPEARAFRAAVIEWLMLNHPHDCPVCDEGGECHLQDMTVMTGHVYRRDRFPKRTYRNQDLGPFVNHEMNRCIHCYRCVRFYQDVAGGRDLVALGWHDHVYFGRHADGPLESEFSGNLIEVCPTGVFTDKTLKAHYTRKWDLQTAPSVCVHCGLGCNTIAGERYGTLRRILSRYNHDVNGYFLCDRGRFGYQFVNSERRIRRPLVRDAGGELRAVSKEEALRRVADMVRGGRAIGIGSPRASLETNFALRSLVGAGNYYSGLAAADAALLGVMLRLLREGPWHTPSLREMGTADAVLMLGEDVNNVAPMVALSLQQAMLQQPLAMARELRVPPWSDTAVREAIQQERGPLFIATPDRTRLDDVAASAYHAAPDDVARFGFMVAHSIHAEAPAVEDADDAVLSLAQHVGACLSDCRQPLVLAGPSCGSEALVRAAAGVARALHASGRKAWLSFTMPECNSMGAAMMGGGTLEAALEALVEGRADTVIIAENEVFRRIEPGAAEDLLDRAKNVIVLDHLASATTERATVVLPAATFAEASGTMVSSEGRAQRFYQVFEPEGEIRASWRWLSDVIASAGIGRGWPGLDHICAAVEDALPDFRGISTISPPAGFRALGQKVPREPQRYSGRTAMTANLDVHEPRPPDDPDAPLSFSMEGYQGEPPPALQPRYWAPGWNSVQAINKFQIEVGGPLHGGDVGRRLIEPADGAGAGHADAVPPAFVPREDEWLVVPAYHVFGSEPLSVLTPGVAELAPQPYVAVGRRDAERLGLGDGWPVTLLLAGRSYTLTLRVHTLLPAGLACLPVGLPGVPALCLPAWGRISVQPGGQAMSPTLRCLVIIFGVLAGLLSVSAGLIWLERRLLALFQERYGPNRLGPFGLVQPLADMVKILAKEDWVPPAADAPVFVIAPCVVVIATLASFAIVPFAPGIVVADLNVGLLFFLAMSSLAVYGVALGGWASNNKYSLLGSVRAAGQMLSYEVFMGLSLMGVVALAGSFSLGDIVDAQKGLWFCIKQPVGLAVFVVAGMAEARRLPFDLPEAENELVAGFHTEYSGMKFAMYFLGEYVGITMVSALTVTLFFGGWRGPWLPPLLWFFLKTMGLVCIIILVRGSLPRPRYDQLMALGWKVMLPLALLNLLATGAVVVAEST